MAPKDEVDKKLKTKVQMDAYEKAGIINIDDRQYVNEFEEL